MTYIEGFVAAELTNGKQAFLDHAHIMADVFKKHGVLKTVDNWGDGVPDGEVTSFPMAVKCEADETVVFSWVVWPSKDARNKGMARVMEDPEMSHDKNPMPFDGKRLIYGGFEKVLET